jgi:hypothetical protein
MGGGWVYCYERERMIVVIGWWFGADEVGW